MKMDYIVLQARLGSKRLPGKLLLPLGGASILEHILLRLKTSRETEGIIVATTADTAARIIHITEKHGARMFIGSEQDVLGRYIGAVKKFQIRNVVRATADNPLVDIGYLDKALVLHRDSGADLTSFPRLPYGTGIEVIKGEVLTKIGTLTRDPFEREHITQYIYHNEGTFRIIRGTPDSPMDQPDVRLTVDTEDDYRKMKDIYENLYKGEPIRVSDALDYLYRKE
jgi:spore coat polysaccharide biosynthesis protein SpsF